MVRHEFFLVFELVEEYVLTVNPYVGVPCFGVDADFLDYFLSWIIFRRSQVGLAELAVSAATPHDLHKTMYGWSYNVRDIFELGPTGHSDYLRARVGFYVLVNLANNVIALAHDNMINAEAFARVLPDLHLPCARPSDHQFRIREILPCGVYAVDEFQEFLFRVSGQFSPVRKHHTDRA